MKKVLCILFLLLVIVNVFAQADEFDIRRSMERIDSITSDTQDKMTKMSILLLEMKEDNELMKGNILHIYNEISGITTNVVYLLIAYFNVLVGMLFLLLCWIKGSHYIKKIFYTRKIKKLEEKNAILEERIAVLENVKVVK